MFRDFIGKITDVLARRPAYNEDSNWPTKREMIVSMEVVVPDKGNDADQWFARLHRQSVEELLLLVEVFSSLPREALVVTLRDRGLAGTVNLALLPYESLVALAVHTHRIGWQAVPRISHRHSPSEDLSGPVMLDLF